MNRFSRTIMAIAMLLLSGCLNGKTLERSAHPKHPTGAQGDPKTFVYECGDSFSFVARIKNETAWLFLPRETLSLPRVVSASGEKYSDGITSFWTKANAALLEHNDTSYRNCVIIGQRPSGNTPN
jgi:putative lipoprotein